MSDNVPDRIDTTKEKQFHNLNVHNISGYLGRGMLYDVGKNSGKPFVKFSIWQLVSGKDGAERGYFDCMAFGLQAEQLRDQEYKARGIMVEGNGRQEVWKDDEGKRHSRYVIMINKFWWINDCKHSDPHTSCNEEPEEGNSGRGSAPKSRAGQRSANAPRTNQPVDDFDEDDDIPF